MLLKAREKVDWRTFSIQMKEMLLHLILLTVILISGCSSEGTIRLYTIAQTTTPTPSFGLPDEDPPPSPSPSPSPSTLPGPSPLPSPSGANCSIPQPAGLKFADKTMIADFLERQCAKIQVCVKHEFWESLPKTTFIPAIDLVLLFDVTGSMDSYIQSMTRNMQQLITNLKTLTPELRMGLATHQDFFDPFYDFDIDQEKPFTPMVPLTTNTVAVKEALSTLVADGGGDSLEPWATAAKAIADGKPFLPYFGSSHMGFEPNPLRTKIILGITDAPNKTIHDPFGPATPFNLVTINEAASVLLAQEILFIGIGSKVQEPPLITPSFSDLALLARNTGAIVQAPGIDLDGDHLTDKEGEVKPGDPAVLQMDLNGRLVGTPPDSDPNKVLADAIAMLVQRITPFKIKLKINAQGRDFSPADSRITAPATYSENLCFEEVVIKPKTPVGESRCVSNSSVIFSAFEELTQTDMMANYFVPTLQLPDLCN